MTSESEFADSSDGGACSSAVHASVQPGERSAAKRSLARLRAVLRSMETKSFECIKGFCLV